MAENKFWVDTIKLPEGYICGCGKEHRYPGYVYAHWRDEIVHTCDCGRQSVIRLGRATPMEERQREMDTDGKRGSRGRKHPNAGGAGARRYADPNRGKKLGNKAATGEPAGASRLHSVCPVLGQSGGRVHRKVRPL